LLVSQKKQLEHTPAAPIPRERSTETTVTVLRIFSVAPARFRNRSTADFGGPPFRRKIQLRSLFSCLAATDQHRASTLAYDEPKGWDVACQEKTWFCHL